MVSDSLSIVACGLGTYISIFTGNPMTIPVLGANPLITLNCIKYILFNIVTAYKIIVHKLFTKEK